LRSGWARWVYLVVFSPILPLLGIMINVKQCLSSISEFANLIATIQTMRRLNPLQMRRAVRDYKYEVNESHMTDECSQYLAQLQKDWERHRVKLGVEALRKEIGDRDRDRESLLSADDASSNGLASLVSNNLPETSSAQRSLDMLFDRTQGKSAWEPVKPPEALGELLDSRYMLPLLFPSDPRLLAASPGKVPLPSHERKKSGMSLSAESEDASMTVASAGSRGALDWRFDGRRVREVGIGTLRWVDGLGYASRWDRAPGPEDDKDHESDKSDEAPVDVEGTMVPHIAPLTRKPSARARAARSSMGGDTERGLEEE